MLFGVLMQCMRLHVTLHLSKPHTADKHTLSGLLRIARNFYNTRSFRNLFKKQKRRFARRVRTVVLNALENDRSTFFAPFSFNSLPFPASCALGRKTAQEKLNHGMLAIRKPRQCGRPRQIKFALECT